jgi:hypothetical protein
VPSGWKPHGARRAGRASPVSHLVSSALHRLPPPSCVAYLVAVSAASTLRAGEGLAGVDFPLLRPSPRAHGLLFETLESCAHMLTTTLQGLVRASAVEGTKAPERYKTSACFSACEITFHNVNGRPASWIVVHIVGRASRLAGTGAIFRKCAEGAAGSPWPCDCARRSAGRRARRRPTSPRDAAARGLRQ